MSSADDVHQRGLQEQEKEDEDTEEDDDDEDVGTSGAEEVRLK